MNQKVFYEESWRLQAAKRAHEGYWPRLRKRFTYDRYQLTAEWLRDLDGELLDVGCGEAQIPALAGPRFSRIVGLDVARNILDGARRKFRALPEPQRYAWIESDLNAAWPLQNSSFDVVTCVAVLEHLLDPYFVIEEIARVLRGKGRLILLVPNLAYLKHRAALLFGRLPRTSGDPVGWDGGHLHYFTFHTVRDLLCEKGFSIEKRSGDGVIGKFRAHFWPNLSVGNIAVRAVKETGKP